MKVAVQVYGQLTKDERDALDRALQQEFASLADAAGEAEPVALTFLDVLAQQIDEPRRACDVRICILAEKGEDWDKTRFFQRLINRYPLVPVVFQSRSKLNWPALAKEARRAVETSWWSIVRPIDLPVMIVDRAERIIKANNVATEFFGPNLVDRPYLAAVEGASHDSRFPNDHPVRDALHLDEADVPPRGVCRYRHVRSDGGKVLRRALLVCFPLINSLDRSVTSVVVFYVDLMNRFDRINEAVKEFALADGVKALQETIIDQVCRMGYQRARLYEYDSKERKLHGRTAIGFKDSTHIDPSHEDAFTRHVLDVQKDHESHNTIINKSPGLFIYEDAPHKDPRSDLVHYCERGEDSSKLEKTEVNRWVDAPLLIPVVDIEGKRSVQPWGKISVDQGRLSDSLSPQDVANLSALAAVAGGALGEKIRASRDEALLNTYEKYTPELEQAERPVSSEPVLPRIKGWLLELFRELFHVDVALYREYRPEDRTLICNQEFVRPTTGCPEPGTRIPREVKVGDFLLYERFGEEFVDEDATVIDPEGIRNYARNWPDQVVRLSAEVESELPHEEVRYLNWIQSEIGIPIVVRNKVRGVIVGMSGRPDAFPPDCDTVLRRFRSVAHLWFQLGELRDARTWSIATLGNCLKAWSLLQGEDDERVYAGLAAILTAGCGLCWHRALIFRNVGASGTDAELVYAVGGLGEKEHGRRHGELENAERNLLELVRKRIDNPKPHGRDPDTGEGPFDSLYRRYVEGPGPRPRVSYSEDPRLFEVLQGRGREHGRAPYLELDRDKPLIRSAEQRYPGLFAARTTYFFPLYAKADEREHDGPLGFIAIDNAYRPNPLEDTALALTAAMIELARDEVSARLRYRLLNGMIGALPFLRHGASIGKRFDEFSQDVDDLLPGLRDPARAAQPSPKLDEARQTWADLKEVVGKLAEAQKLIEGFEHPEKVTDLKARLLEVIDVWEETRQAAFVVKSVELEDGLSLECDVAVFDGALRCVLENAESVSRRDDRGRFLVELSAISRRDIPGFKVMITIEITDYGPGIADDDAPYIFVDGFSHRPAVHDRGPQPLGTQRHHTGRGLGMARAFLLRSHGDLWLKEARGNGKGATFAIHLGRV